MGWKAGMAKRCYYEVLEVERSANDGELKTAFRKLAMKWHPDRNPGDKDCEHRFKEINEAYEVLKDADKRAAYNRFGHCRLRAWQLAGMALVRISAPRSPTCSRASSAWADVAAATAASAAPISATTWRSDSRRHSPARPRR